MGIGGQGISAVAQMALIAGDTVTGCDQNRSATTKALEQLGIEVQIGHSPQHLVDTDALIYVPAVEALNPNNPELIAARAQGMQVITWQEMLGKMMLGKCVLSVSGVHGKGTTTALLALMLVDAGLDPTCEIGAVVPRFGTNYRLGKSQYFVNEADEFNHNFWHYHPRLAIVTSIEFEHPEFYVDYTAFLAAFEHFVRGMDLSSNWPLPPTLILNADSAGCLELRDRLSDWQGHIVMYAIAENGVHSPSTPAIDDAKRTQKASSSFQAYDVKLNGETSFRVRLPDGEAFLGGRTIYLQLPGIHNVQNALAALTAAYMVGVDAEVIVKTLETFDGIRRRFEIRHQGPLKTSAFTRPGNEAAPLNQASLATDYVLPSVSQAARHTVRGQPGRVENGEIQDVVLVDDYAHHPTAIVATLEAARRRYVGRRLVAVYQPHMFSRTKTFFEQFVYAFDLADIAIIVDIFPGREHDTGLISAQELVEAMRKQAHFTQAGMQVIYGGNVQATTQLLRRILRAGDVVLLMGAGDIYLVTEMLLQDSVSV